MIKPTSFFLILLTFFNLNAKSQALLTGKITTINNTPVSNVSISVLNSNIKSISDSNGLFKIKLAATGTYQLEINHFNFASIHPVIKIENNKSDYAANYILEASINTLDEIIVTAQKKEELIQKIPSSITALNAKQVSAFNLWNTKEITGIIPNLYSADPGDGRDVTSVRGIATSSYDPTVTTYIDGVNQFSLDTYIPTLFDIERIEVLRGPQGTLYGRNAMGGVINIITKQPTNTTTGFVDLSIGNYNQQRTIVGFKTPFVKNKLFAGASLLYNKRDGFYTNEYTSSSYDQQNIMSGNYFLKYVANEK